MQGVVHCLQGDEWTEVYLECCDGTLHSFEVDDGDKSIPFALSGEASNELVLELTASVTFANNCHPDPPTNFGLELAQGDLKLLICAPSNKDLVKWRAALRATRSVTSNDSSGPERRMSPLAR